MEQSQDTVDKATLLEGIRRSSMPEKEKRKWARFVRGIRGHSEGIDKYLVKIAKDLKIDVGRATDG